VGRTKPRKYIRRRSQKVRHWGRPSIGQPALVSSSRTNDQGRLTAVWTDIERPWSSAAGHACCHSVRHPGASGSACSGEVAVDQAGRTVGPSTPDELLPGVRHLLFQVSVSRSRTAYVATAISIGWTLMEIARRSRPEWKIRRRPVSTMRCRQGEEKK
jgi:hypothetical protein